MLNELDPHHMAHRHHIIATCDGCISEQTKRRLFSAFFIGSTVIIARQLVNLSTSDLARAGANDLNALLLAFDDNGGPR